MSSEPTTSKRGGADPEGEESLVQVERIAAGGDGLGRQPDGRVVFVPRTAPGELVEVRLTETHATWARGELIALLDPSPRRRDPPCPYYDRCGGCQIQHLEYEAQLQAKSEIIVDALTRLGGFEDLELPAIYGDPDREFGYRNRITLTLRRVDGQLYAGYHAYDAPGHIVDVDHCPLAEEPINRVWGRLRESWGPDAGRLPEGPELRLTLRSNQEGEVGLTVGPGDAGQPVGRGDPEALLREVEGLVAIWGLDDSGGILWHAGPEYLSDRWGPRELRLAGDSFVQVNRRIASALEEYVRGQAGDVSGLRVIDAYCGYGVRGLELARSGAEVVGIDVEPRAVEMAERMAREEELPASFLRAPVERALIEELPADLVILNPPRRGVEEPVIEALTGELPGRIIYVSCDPATLARDLGRLSPPFGIREFVGFDMFPQTAHVETVVSLGLA